MPGYNCKMIVATDGQIEVEFGINEFYCMYFYLSISHIQVFNIFPFQKKKKEFHCIQFGWKTK